MIKKFLLLTEKFLLLALLLCILILAELFSLSFCDWSLSTYTLFGREPTRHADFFFMGYHIFSPGVLKEMIKTYAGLHSFVVWPPLYYLTFGPIVKLFGFEGLNWFPLYFARLVLWWLYGLVLWALGKKVWASLEGGLLALSLLWLNPVILSITSNLDTDFPAFVALAAATWALLYSNDFSKVKRSALFGLLCGFALLTRAATAVFVIGLYLAALWFVWTSNPENRVKAFKNLVIAALITSFCAALFYGPLLINFMKFASHEFFGRSLSKWPSYLRAIAKNSTNLFSPMLITFLLASIFLILKRDKYLFAFAPLFLISFVFFSSSTAHSEDETFTYILPILIFLVVFIIRSISLISSSILKICVSAALILFGIISFARNYPLNTSTSYNRCATDMVRYLAGLIWHLPDKDNRYKDAIFPNASLFPSDTSNDDFFISNLALIQILKSSYFEDIKDSPPVIIFREASKDRGGWSLGYIVYRYSIPTQWFCSYSDTLCITANVGRRDNVFFVDNKKWCLEAKEFFLGLGREIERAMYIKSLPPNPDGVGFCIVRFKDVEQR